MDPTIVSQIRIELLQDFFKSWPFLLFIGGAMFQAAGTFYLIRYHSKSIKELKEGSVVLENKYHELSGSIRDQGNEISKTVAKHLYDDRHQSLYMPVDSCRKCQDDCLKQRTKELNYLATEIRDQKKMVAGYFKYFIKLTNKNNAAIVKMIKRRSSNKPNK